MHQVGFSLNDYIQSHGQQNIKPRSTVGHGLLKKENFHICNKFTGIPRVVQCKLASKQMFCFTVLHFYFLLVVYSLYRKLIGIAQPYRVWRVRPNVTLLKRKCYNRCLPLHLGCVLLMFIYIHTCIYVFKCALINISIGREWLRTKALAQTPRQGVSSTLTH